MSGRNRLVAAAAAAALVLTVSACGGSEETESAEAASVTYLTSFGTFGRDSYAYVALEKGYFQEAGLKVTIKPGTGTVDVMKLIGSGQADYGTGDLSGVITTMANEKLPVRAVAAIHQQSMAGIASLDKAIDSPEKLSGASIADSSGSTNMIIFPAYAKAAGIDPKSVKFVPSSPQSLPQLLAAGSVDAIGQFVAGKPLLEKAAGGKTVTMLPYADKLPDLYGNGLLVSAEKLGQRPRRGREVHGGAGQGPGLCGGAPRGSRPVAQEARPDGRREGRRRRTHRDAAVRPGRRRAPGARPGAGGIDDPTARRHRHPQVDPERR